MLRHYKHQQVAIYFQYYKKNCRWQLNDGYHKESNHWCSPQKVDSYLSYLCGQVYYEITPPYSTFQYCFRSRWRKATGSDHASNIIIPPEQFNELNVNLTAHIAILGFDFSYRLGKTREKHLSMNCLRYINKSKKSVEVADLYTLTFPKQASGISYLDISNIQRPI